MVLAHMIYYQDFPPNNKIWGSLLEEGNALGGMMARGSELGARGRMGGTRIGIAARGSELGLGAREDWMDGTRIGTGDSRISLRTILCEIVLEKSGIFN